MLIGFESPAGFGHKNRRARDEAHIPTIKPGSQEPPRVPRTHGHQGRAQDPEQSPCQRPREAERVSASHVLTDLKPPVGPDDGTPAVSVCLQVLKKRGDFIRASNAQRQGTPGIHLQARKRATGEATGMRVGFTCSKKVGNAVARNRAKRRLREVARIVLPQSGRDGWDYVLVGRKDVTATLPFTTLINDLTRALQKVHG